MNLRELLKQASVVSLTGSEDVEISGVCADSRHVKKGFLFVAVPGAQKNGSDYIRSALDAGAIAVAAEKLPERLPVAGVVVQSARKAVADLAAAFYEHPSSALKVAGVTGTNGKTTTTFLIQHICNTALLRCGLIGTIRYQIGDKSIPAHRTTPDAVETQELLSQMRNAGCKSVAMEVSSHAISQDRVRGIEFDAALFTNLTQDHLDYHGSMDAYFESKASFVTGLGLQRFKEGTAIINCDDRYGALLLDRALQAGVKVISFGVGQRADFRASNCRTDSNGTSFQLDAVGRSWLVRTPFSGMFNVSNAIGAIAAAYVLGVDVRTAVLALADAPPVPGRMEPVPGKRAFRVFVDYAHTDDALRNALRTLRELQPRRIVTVFGCGGDRDKSKRPLMGAVSEELSDWTIITSDNPRSESPESIATDVAAGMRRKQHEVILDRKAAITRAVELAGPRDIILIAGKGHETTQETAGRFEPFDDVAVARAALENRPSDFGR